MAATVPAILKVATTNTLSGGSFLITNPTPDDCFFPEDFTEEHRQIARTADSFCVNQVLPNSPAIEAKDYVLTRRLLKEAADLGLAAVDIPEEYGGLELDRIASAIVTEGLARHGSFSVAFSASAGIGTLPLLWYGTPAQKQKYLPGLADGTIVAAYALSESTSGSDALNARTRAVLSADGQTYTLNGEKMWISNAGFADLFTVFAKCLVPAGPGSGPGGHPEEKLTAFLIERNTPGLSIGPEEHKLGIRGSSTCPLILADCRIPAANLLGEVGRGHSVAFNILNVGRYKLGLSVLGGARHTLNAGIPYARERKAFGKSISSFGLIQEKIADCATDIFVAEAVIYRVVGLIERALSTVDKNDTGAIQKTIEGYAAECSIVKVWSSEMFERVADEVLQIFGGYGYVEDYPAERAYRDARINRIFEGTNEINRLIITGWLIKSASSGKLPLLPAIKQLMDEVLSGPQLRDLDHTDNSPLAQAFVLLRAAKQLTLFTAGAATERYSTALADQQEVMAAIADSVIEVFAIESALLRAQKLLDKTARQVTIVTAMARLYAASALDRVELASRKVIAAVAEGDQLRIQLTLLRRLAKHDLTDTISLRRQIATHMVAAGKYTLQES